MNQRGLTPALEAELTRIIQGIEAEDKHLKLFLNDTNPQAQVSSVGEEGQVGVTIPRYMGMAESFITNPSSVGVGIIARMIETEPTILSSIQFKTLMMLAKVGEYMHEDTVIQEFVRDFISKMYGPTFKESLESQASKYGYGFSISEIIWGLNKQNQKVPVKVKTYHPSTICFEVDPYGEITDMGIIQFVIQNMQHSNPNHYFPQYQYGFQVKNPFTTPNDFLLPYRMPFLSNYGLTRIPKSKVIHHVNSVGLAFGSPYGKSAVRTAHLAWQLKVFFQKQMGIAGKRQASPFIWGTAPHNVNKVRIEKPDGSAVDMNAIDALSAVLRNRSDDDSVVTGPESAGYKVQAVAATMDLNQYLAVLSWLDVQMFRSFLLPSLVMTDGSAGSRSLGDKHFQVVDRIAEEEAQVFTQTVIDQLVRPAIAMNFGEQDNYGHFAQRPQNIEERERLTNMFCNLANAGYMKAYDPTDGAYVRSTLHLPEQEESFYTEPMPNLGALEDGQDAQPEGDSAPDETTDPNDSSLQSLSEAERLQALSSDITTGDQVVVTEDLRDGRVKAGEKGQVVEDSSSGYCAVRIGSRTYVVKKTQIRKTH